VAHAEPARLGEERQAVRAVADRDLLDELPGGGVDHVDLGVVPAAEPQLLSVAADTAHVRAARRTSTSSRSPRSSSSAWPAAISATSATCPSTRPPSKARARPEAHWASS